MQWRIEGFKSGNPTGFSREETGSEAKITLLLERLAALHLTPDEIAEATLGSGTHFHINRDKRPGEQTQLMTTGNPYYVAIEIMSAPRSPRDRTMLSSS